MATLSSTPRADGFFMPAEYAPHDGCWMIWPERPDNWRLGAKPAQAAFAAVAAAIAAAEPVTMAVSAAQYANARAMLPDSVRVARLPANDCWMRDVGPTFVIDGRGGRRGVDWRFNAWGGLQGGLYAPWDLDEQVAQQVLDIEGAPRYAAPLVMEGGSIHTDGEGTLLVTEECLLNRNRNPHLTRAEIEGYLRDYTGAEAIIWLGRGVYLDETDGHVDNLACFTAPGQVALTWTGDKSDPQYEISCDALRRLDAARDARGRPLQAHLIHQPGPLFMTDGEAAGLITAPGTHPRPAGGRLAGSYINFYIGNGIVVMPLLDPRFDDAARGQLQALFPGRDIVGAPAREILLGGGNIHCITQQVPKA